LTSVTDADKHERVEQSGQELAPGWCAAKPRFLSRRLPASCAGSVPEVVVAERSLALAIGMSGERAGALAPQPWHAREAADRVVGTDATDEVADRLAADVRQRRARADVVQMTRTIARSHIAGGGWL
jgi:hypothetical protein